MTPSDVKLVCVDINPSVVSKLADRGSLEAVGIVTDVGLFLQILSKNLCNSVKMGTLLQKAYKFLYRD